MAKNPNQKVLIMMKTLTNKSNTMNQENAEYLIIMGNWKFFIILKKSCYSIYKVHYNNLEIMHLH